MKMWQFLQPQQAEHKLIHVLLVFLSPELRIWFLLSGSGSDTENCRRKVKENHEIGTGRLEFCLRLKNIC